MAKPFYEFVGREPNPPYTDRLVWQNRADPTDRISGSEWWFWRLWRFTDAWLAYQREMANAD